MAKKKFNLSPDMVQLTPTELSNERIVPPKPSIKKKVKVTLSIEEEYIKTIKLWCIKNDMTISQLLINGFKKLKSETDDI